MAARELHDVGPALTLHETSLPLRQLLSVYLSPCGMFTLRYKSIKVVHRNIKL